MKADPDAAQARTSSAGPRADAEPAFPGSKCMRAKRCRRPRRTSWQAQTPTLPSVKGRNRRERGPRSGLDSGHPRHQRRAQIGQSRRPGTALPTIGSAGIVPDGEATPGRRVSLRNNASGRRAKELLSQANRRRVSSARRAARLPRRLPEARAQRKTASPTTSGRSALVKGPHGSTRRNGHHGADSSSVLPGINAAHGSGRADG